MEEKKSGIFLRLWVRYWALGKDLKSKDQNYPIHQIIFWSTKKQQRLDSTFLDVHDRWKITIMTSYHQIGDDVITSFSDLKRLIPILYSYQVSPSSDLK